MLSKPLGTAASGGNVDTHERTFNRHRYVRSLRGRPFGLPVLPTLSMRRLRLPSAAALRTTCGKYSINAELPTALQFSTDPFRQLSVAVLSHRGNAADAPAQPTSSSFLHRSIAKTRGTSTSVSASMGNAAPNGALREYVAGPSGLQGDLAARAHLRLLTCSVKPEASVPVCTD